MRYATVPAAAEYIASSEQTIRRWIGTGKLTAFRQGRRILRVDLNEIDALLSPKSGGARG